MSSGGSTQASSSTPARDRAAPQVGVDAVRARRRSGTRNARGCRAYSIFSSRDMPHVCAGGDDRESTDRAPATDASRRTWSLCSAGAAVRDRRLPLPFARSRPAASRSAAAPARSPADSGPRRPHPPAAPAGCSRARIRRAHRRRARGPRRWPARARGSRRARAPGRDRP